MERGPSRKPAGHFGKMPTGMLELSYGRDVSAQASPPGCGQELQSDARPALPLRWRGLRTELPIIVINVCQP
jgi:hypothetical protein